MESLNRPVGALEEERGDALFGDMHLWDYVQIVLRRLPLALSMFMLVVFVVVLYTWTRTPLYKASAEILVQPSQVNFTGLKEALETQLPPYAMREYMQTQVELITSEPVLNTAIDKAGLRNDPAFASMKNPAAYLGRALKVSSVRGTQLIRITLLRPNPQEAARIVNAAVAAFIEENQKRRFGISDEGLAEMRKQADLLRAKLDAATRELHDFMVKNNIVSFEKTQNVVIDRLSDLSKNLTQIEPIRMNCESKLQAARDAIAAGKPIDSLPEVSVSPMINQLKITLAGLEQDYAQRRERLGSNHPELMAMETQIETLQNKIAIEAQSILNALETQYLQSKGEEDLRRAALEQYREEVFRFSSLASDYEVLSQSKQSVQNTYDTIIRRIQEIDINRMGGQGENMFVVAKATVPDGKAWPNKKKNLLLAGMFGLILAIGLCFFLDYLDMTIKSEMEVKHLLRCNVLTGIPDTGLEARESENTDMFSVQSPRSHFAEAFRTLRTALAFGHATPLRHIVVSSTFSKEGKTISAINLGIAQAQVGRRTLLVDADMRKPRLQRVFKANTQQGLSNLLTDRASVDLDKVIQPTSVENLFVLPCGPIPPKSVELLDSENFARLSKELVGKFDFVIYDSPPSFSMVDSMVIGKHTDGVILVVRSFVTPKNAARDLASRLRLAQVRLLGIILNNVDQPKGGYYYGGYYYGGYYYGRYSYYYSHYYEEEQSGKRPVKGWRRWLGPLAGHKKKLPPPVKPAAT